MQIILFTQDDTQLGFIKYTSPYPIFSINLTVSSHHILQHFNFLLSIFNVKLVLFHNSWEGRGCLNKYEILSSNLFQIQIN